MFGKFRVLWGPFPPHVLLLLLRHKKLTYFVSHFLWEEKCLPNQTFVWNPLSEGGALFGSLTHPLSCVLSWGPTCITCIMSPPRECKVMIPFFLEAGAQLIGLASLHRFTSVFNSHINLVWNPSSTGFKVEQQGASLFFTKPYSQIVDPLMLCWGVVVGDIR